MLARTQIIDFLIFFVYLYVLILRLMLTKGFLRPQISIKKIGRTQFWTGILLGVFSAFVFNILFNYARESFRFLTFIRNPLILSTKEFMIYDLFFAALSVSLAFGLTVIVWLTGRKDIKKQYYRMFAVGNIYMMIFVIIFLILRIGSTLYFVLFTGFGYDKHLDFIKEFWIILLLLPIFIFFFNWKYLRLMFRSGYWVSISVVAYILLTFILFKTTPVDKSILNNIYYSKNREKFDFIDRRLDLSTKLYGVTFTDTTREILKKQYSYKTFRLVKKLKKAFDTDSLVSLDTLILESIVIHNHNIQGAFLNKYLHKDKEMNWPFATPEQIYNQIKRYGSKSGVETKFLIDILNEMIFIFEPPDIDWNKRNKYSDYDIQTYQFKQAMRRVTKNIEKQLTDVVTRLRFDKENKTNRYQFREMEIK